ncbi:WhiB family transcriptional regulator [Mycolicibacterium goodii]|uniref:WhiB family transcriptional regulator n=1 Tax=Mycolicibacterium goodii TaxID=134601 RepID=UPI001BDD318A|nr:WhiB family transcriptional regulator [Mycolicibacterium goodii]MBU8820475.1 WhiB family transcriptional regulator [Mycolicibacterium goodii]
MSERVWGDREKGREKAGLFALPDDGQLALFEPAAAPAERVEIAVPTAERPTPCRTAGAGADLWTDARAFPVLIEVCAACPFQRWCATQALDLHTDGYRVVGVWAGVDFTETDRSGRYRRRIQRLEALARGERPRTRRSARSRRPVVAA